MGTNYYHHPKPPCECCGRAWEPRHIGKSSCGWCFALHVYPDDGIRGIDDWVRQWQSGVIKDEYGHQVTPAEMLSKIVDRERVGKPPLDSQWLASNSAVRGPKGLARRRLERHRVVGYGDGPWDLCVGEFS